MNNKKPIYILENIKQITKTGEKYINIIGVIWFITFTISFVYLLFLAKPLKNFNIPHLITAIYLLPTIIIYIVIHMISEICSEQSYKIRILTSTQKSETLHISKSSIIADILSDKYEFSGCIHEHTPNTNKSKTLIRIPITKEEFNKILEHINTYENYEQQCMNPDIIVDT